MTPPLREALKAWALAFAALLATFAVAPAFAKVSATVAFLYLPLAFGRRRGEDAADFGLHLRGWKRDAALAGLVLGAVAPLFVLGFWAFAELLPHLPDAVRALVTPFQGTPRFHLRAPARFGEWAVDQLFVVALPEEFFYRGFVQKRLDEAWPPTRRLLGAPVGRALWVTALLFALGHLAIFQVWRLAVFFPALLFGWMRARSGTVVGAAAVHAGFNLLEMVLEASFFGAR